MKSKNTILFDGIFSVFILFISFLLNLELQQMFHTQSLIPMVFVLGVFLISWRTTGYFWGISSSLVSVLAVNYTFTYPYWAFDLITPECIFSAFVMLVVSIMTSALTTRIKVQEKIRSEVEMEHMRANLLRAVSHDLRTPLTSIYGSSSTIIENYDLLTREQILKLLGEVQDDAQWLIGMVENLLSVTRIDSGSMNISKSPAVLEELIDNVIVKFRKHYPHVNFKAELPEEFITIPMDNLLIQQVLLNLLENAVYHAVGMTCLTLCVELHGKKVLFKISDNGCGIPAERMNSLFTGYMEPRNSPSDGTRHNMGIGLSVCSAIVKAHGSEINAQNNPDGGACFLFYLDMEEQNE